MADTWNKREREKKKQQNKKDKMERKLERKENAKDGNNLESMMAYIDEEGNLSATPMDPRKKVKLNAEDIVIGVPRKEELEAEDKERKGTVTFFNGSKGYGFIRDLESQQSIFVHINELSEPVSEQDKVTFELAKGPKGPVATRVKLLRS